MTDNPASRWYVVHTQPHSETRAVQHLRQQGFEAYCPCYQRRRRHARRVDTVSAPLFPRYIFVSLNLALDRWRAVQSTIGVISLVCRGDEPASIPDAAIAEIKLRENAEGFVIVNFASSFARGDKVRVMDGAFSTYDGIFEEMTDQNRVHILLDLLGRKVRVMLEPERLEAV